MPKTTALTPEDRAELERRYCADQPREAILDWLRCKGYAHTWDSVQHIGCCNGWKGRSRGPKTGAKVQRVQNLGPYYAESELGTP